MRPRQLGQYALLATLLALLGMFLVYPVWLTVGGAFAADPRTGKGFTLDHILFVFADPVLRGGLVNTLMVATATTGLCILIALPLAMLAARYRYPLKGAWNALILVPLILPPFVGAIGLRMILGRFGSLNTLRESVWEGLSQTLVGQIGAVEWLFGADWDILGSGKFWGVVIAEALHLYPIIYLNATAALANLDPALDEAAENLGIGPWRRFFRVTLPMIRPGLFAGGTIVFIWSFTELGTPLMFDFYATTPVQVFNGIKEVTSSAQPYALTVVMLAAAVLCYVVGKVAFGGRAYASQTRAGRASAEKPLTGWRGWLACLAFGAVTALALMPHVGVTLTSFAAEGSWYRSIIPTAFTGEHYEGALTHPVAFGSILNSLKLASSAMLIDIFAGVLIGYIIVRTKVKGRGLLDTMAMLPLAVPGLVMAFGYVAMSLRWPFGGGGEGGPLSGFASILGATPNPVPFLIIAYAVRRLPYVVRATVAGLEQTSGDLEEAARNLGAGAVTAVRKVIVPLIMANLIAGGLLAFSFAMLEVSDSLILAQQEMHYPITKAIYMFSERLGDGLHIASAMGVWGMALLTVTLVGASVLMGKKLGAIFRV